MYQYNHSFVKLLKRDRRYKMEAYAFVYETLDYAQNVLQMGKDEETEPLPDTLQVESEELETMKDADKDSGIGGPKHHISGQDLCRAARDYAVEQYGYLAKMVLESIGIHCTGDIGEIVYNLIRIGQMRKTPADSREDFDNVFDFDSAFKEKYRITKH